MAKELSTSSTHPMHKMGCVIVNRGRVISKGVNKAKTHPKSPHPWRHIHAEIDAVMRVPLDALKGATIYVYRQMKDGSPALAKPCPSCYKKLIELGIDKICYTENGYYKYV